MSGLKKTLGGKDAQDPWNIDVLLTRMQDVGSVEITAFFFDVGNTILAICEVVGPVKVSHIATTVWRVEVA